MSDDLPPNWLLPIGAYAYLATPYSKFPGGLETAHDAACRLSARLMDAGWPIFCPIAHTHVVAKYMQHDPRDSLFWININRGPLVNAAGLIVALMDGWSDSAGIEAEVAEIRALMRPVIAINPNTMQWRNHD